MDDYIIHTIAYTIGFVIGALSVCAIIVFVDNYKQRRRLKKCNEQFKKAMEGSEILRKKQERRHRIRTT